MKWKTVLVAIVKDEGPYLADWLAYHIALGIDHFFIYDNGSSDATLAVSRRFVNAGFVTSINWPMRGGQTDAYSHALVLLKNNTEWAGFLDVDEFVVLHDHQTIGDFLASAAWDQVLLPWRNFPYGGHQAQPGGSTLENFFWAYKAGPDASTQVKHFVRPELVTRINVHFSYITSDRTFISDRQEHKPLHAIRGASYRGAQINHYATRSFYENQERFRKGQVSGSSHKKIDDFFPMTPAAAGKLDYDDSILRHLPEFKAARTFWNAVSETPHRYGLRQRTKVLPSFNNVMFYLTKSFGNYLNAEPSILPVSSYEFMRVGAGGQATNITNSLIDYQEPSVCFAVTGMPFTRFFQGTIHYGDFSRRFGFDCLVSVRQEPVRGHWAHSILVGNRSVLALVVLDSKAGAHIALASSAKNGPAQSVDVPPGRHVAILYLPDTANVPRAERTITLQSRGIFTLDELILGTLP